MTRIALKVAGMQGQGINSVGEMCAKGLKRKGYCVFGYREYMSIIKGGHSTYQLDVSNEKVESNESRVDIMVCLNHYGLQKNLRDVKTGGTLLHNTPEWKFPDEDQKFIDDNNVTVLYFPTENIIKELKGRPILGNMLLTSVLWSLIGQTEDSLKELVKEQFGHKSEKLVELNHECVKRGFAFRGEEAADVNIPLPDADSSWSDHLLLTGSHAMGLGTIHGGCRFYSGYPMTPSSPLFKYLADVQNQSGMIIKQAEDEITGVQMMSGAMYMGTRALTATSGGGYDLMTETVSMNGIMENPAVIALSQRPGPGTGLPTWTAQGDLLLAAASAHGEFPHLVVSVSDSQDGFDLMPEAFNYAEEYQTPVVVLYDKQIAEALYTQKPYDQKKAEIRRGKLVTDKKKLAALKASDRYDPSAPDGISPRWLPGAEAETYCAQGDEHNADGSVDETGPNAADQMDKRMRKMDALKKSLPAPEVFGAKDPDVVIVSWGSNKGVIIDAMQSDQLKDKKIAYVHYTYMWPLKTKTFDDLASKAKQSILIECNKQGQLGMLLKMESGIECTDRILKYDGRPFFYDELVSQLSSTIA